MSNDTIYWWMISGHGKGGPFCLRAQLAIKDLPIILNRHPCREAKALIIHREKKK